MYHVGLDVGDSCSSLEILDPHGKQFKHLEVKGRWPVLLQRIEKDVPRPFAICFEASCGYGYLHDRLARLATRVEVAHPGQLRLIFKSKRKHNRIDSQKLAKLLFLDEVPRAWVPRADVRSWRATIEFRQKLLAHRVGLKNQIRALLKNHGVQTPRGLWSRTGIGWLKNVTFAEPEALKRDVLLDQLEESNQQIKRVESHLKKVANANPAVTLLQTIPGVGIRTAEAFVAYVDDIARFGRIKQVGTYFGLVPCQDASGNVNRLGHITRDGPATVRKMLTEAAWQAIRRSTTVRAFFERIQHEDPRRKKIALVATAHYLARVMASMLRSGECWRHKEQEPQSQEAPLRKTPDA
jgi:transposase